MNDAKPFMYFHKVSRGFEEKTILPMTIAIKDHTKNSNDRGTGIAAMEFENGVRCILSLFL
jgi:hypothetical protein